MHAIMKTMCPPGYHHSGFVVNHAHRDMLYRTSCAQVTVVHSAVFTEHLVYACVVVTLIFRNDNSLTLRQELTCINSKILEFITETYEKT